LRSNQQRKKHAVAGTKLCFLRSNQQRKKHAGGSGPQQRRQRALRHPDGAGGRPHSPGPAPGGHRGPLRFRIRRQDSQQLAAGLEEKKRLGAAGGQRLLAGLRLLAGKPGPLAIGERGDSRQLELDPGYRRKAGLRRDAGLLRPRKGARGGGGERGGGPAGGGWAAGAGKYLGRSGNVILGVANAVK